MDKRIIYVSFATANTPYVKVMEKFLLPTLLKFELAYDITYPEDFGDWDKNTRYKAQFLKEMLLKHKQPIVFLDADATIEQYPILFDTLLTSDYDFGVHYFNDDYFWHHIMNSDKRTTLSGTIFLNYNEKVLKFLDEWISENPKHLDILEQKVMQLIIEKNQHGMKICDLPIQYVAIAKRQDIVPGFIQNPIIIHHQTSRLYRDRKSK